MTNSTISPKYQVVIPKEVRRKIPIKSGQKVTLLAKNGIIYIIPRMPIKNLRGSLPKISTEDLREKHDRI